MFYGLVGNGDLDTKLHEILNGVLARDRYRQRVELDKWRFILLVLGSAMLLLAFIVLCPFAKFPVVK